MADEKPKRSHDAHHSAFEEAVRRALNTPKPKGGWPKAAKSKRKPDKR